MEDPNPLNFADLPLKTRNSTGNHPLRNTLKVLSNIVVVFLVVVAVSFLASFSEDRGIGQFSDTGRLNVNDFFGIKAAHAEPLKGYEAMKVVGSIHVALRPGESKTVTFGFLNRGTTTWTRDGQGFVSLYTYDPKYRTSVFQDSSWYRREQPARLKEERVAPGEVGHIEFVLHAPSTPGQYYESFHLAAEDIAWIPGGDLVLNIPVSNDFSSPAATTSDSASADGYAAALLIKSSKEVTAKAGETISYTVGLKNTGVKSWTTRKITLPGVMIAATGSDYSHSSWVDGSTLLVKADSPVNPGALDLLTFQFSAPRTKGDHTVKFVLVADGVAVPGGEINIPVTVTSNAPKIYNQPKDEGIQSGETVDEPMIRVGTMIIDEETDWEIVLTCETDYKIRDGNSALLGEMDSGDEVKVFYKNGKYWFNRGKGLESSSFYIRIIPNVENSVCTATNFDRRLTRNAAHADNQFRNILEVRYNSTKDRTWLINELPIELYLRGLAETSNISHQEFQKALIVVARTYAYYHFERGTKRGPEFFHVTAYADDQVYNGYGQEARSPRLTESVKATEGVIVTYDGETAITPYFSRSDGRTRDWSEVWYGDVEWLKSVPVPCDEGKTLWGHGVGMSASGALCMANDGEKWEDILRYFYQGVDLTERW